MIRAKRLRAMRRLLDYAVAESQDLQLANLEHLLGAAAVAIDDAIAAAEATSTPSGEAYIKLVVDTARAGTEPTRPTPDLSRPATAR
jgi:hypothetical protein